MSAEEWAAALAQDDIARAAEANRIDCEERRRANRARFWITTLQAASVLLFIAFVVLLCGVI